jgi:hypothetical protein
MREIAIPWGKDYIFQKKKKINNNNNIMYGFFSNFLWIPIKMCELLPNKRI